MVHLLLVIIYLSFISLGLPDPLLGAAWPTMHLEFGVPVSYAGGISMVITFCTIISSLLSDRMTLKFGTGKITAVSVAVTAVALIGFSLSGEYWMLLLWAIPYGLGAGNVDASLNNYVAVHFASRHMSWLHCMWGVGATVGPYVMGAALSGGMGWNTGYRYIAILQVILSCVLFVSLPLWKERKVQKQEKEPTKPLTLKQIFRIPGIPEVMIAFFCGCAMETVVGLWASSYFVDQHQISTDLAATYGSLFFIGMTIGRAISGFLTYKLNDTQMIRLGASLIGFGIIIMMLPLGIGSGISGLVVMGLGCAPVYPCIIHSTPAHFGEENSQAIIGVQMASAYSGVLLLPPLFGLVANHLSAALLPVYLIPVLGMMVWMHEKLVKIHPDC